MKIHFSLPFFLALLLLACQQPQNYFDLMQQPEKIDSIVSACEDPNSNYDEAFCREAKKASRDFSFLLIELSMRMEYFGSRILDLQIKEASLKKELNEFSSDLSSTSSPSSSQIELDLKKEREKALEQISIYLSVIRYSDRQHR